MHRLPAAVKHSCEAYRKRAQPLKQLQQGPGYPGISGAAYLYLAIAHAHLKPNLRKGRRPAAYFTVTHTKARPMPGTHNHLTFQRSLIQRATSVCAGGSDSIDRSLQAQQQYRRTIGLSSMQRALGDVRFFSNHHKILWGFLPVRMVDLCALAKHHLAAQVCAKQQDHQPN